MERVTILGFGSLLSEKSARTTFPGLESFRLGRVHNYKRVFAQPASIFFRRGIANKDTLEMSSLSAEYCPGSSFICSVFEVSNTNGEFMAIQSAEENDTEGEFTPSLAFREREEEFDIILVPFKELNDSSSLSNATDSMANLNPEKGLLCARSTDEKYISRWGQKRYDEYYGKYGIETIWNWSETSGLRPCATYLRHCVLASKSMGKECYNSFLDETYLVDRQTTIRKYLVDHPEVMETLPPPELRERYGG